MHYQVARLRHYLQAWDGAPERAIGRVWLIATGWRRRYPVGGHYVYLAHPRLKLALIAERTAYSRDIVKEYELEQELSTLGWRVKYLQYERTKSNPFKVREDIRQWFYRVAKVRFRPE